jgi:carboxyl-terminal processing protease
MNDFFVSRLRLSFIYKIKSAYCACSLALLAACGGGGGGDAAPAASPANLSPTDPAPVTAPQVTTTQASAPQPSTAQAATPTSTVSVTAASVAQQCVKPRTTANADETTDKQGTLDTEKAWVRAYMDETYFWYKDIPTVDAGSTTFTLAANQDSVFRTLSAYFDALLTPKRTASDKQVDQFSFTTPTADRNNVEAGVSSGYGIRFTFIKRTPPGRLLRVLYVEPKSPAALAGVQRGDTVKSVDGISIDTTDDADLAILNAGISPAVASKTTKFGLQAADASTPRDVVVTSSTTVEVVPVPLSKAINYGDNKVGYLVLNSFSIRSAEKQLISAITDLKAASVNELVLDLRYNGGGFLALSNQLSWMIGDASLKGKTYEKTICNDKNPFSLCNEADPFRQLTLGFTPDVAAGKPLPQLGLKRVFVLTSASTCSASESLINGLSPFLEVIRIGSTTCGKPYGFFIKDNCGTSYAAIQFRGENAAGFGDFADGFNPTCTVADDLSKQRGDTKESMLAGALDYIHTGSCPVKPTGTGSQKLNVLDNGNYKVMRGPMEEMRIMSLPAGVQ